MQAEEKCVRVTITGTNDDGEAITFTTRGTLASHRSGWLLRYAELSPDGAEELQSFVLCEGQRVTVTRAGETLSTMVFQAQETFLSDYQTPAGSFQVLVLPTEVSIKRRGLIGHVRLVYQLSLSTAFTPFQEMGTRVLDIRFVPCRN